MKRTGFVTASAMGAVVLSTSLLLGATGDLLISYESKNGTAPDQQGWEHEGRCYKNSCPNAADNDCRWQGNTSGNVCGASAGQGCHRPEAHFNFPPEPPGTPSGCTYTEWLAFDNDGANLVHPDTSFGAGPTPKGAANFAGAPPYLVLRLVGADGNGIAGSLPANSSSNRNSGKVRIKKDYSASYNGPITAVYRGALASKQPGKQTMPFMRLRVTNSAGNQWRDFMIFQFSDTSLNDGPDIGRFGATARVSGQPERAEFVPGMTRVVPIDFNPGKPGGPQDPSVRRFFTLRVICDPDANAATFYLDEDTPNMQQGVINSTTVPGFSFPATSAVLRATEFGVTENTDATMWVDYFRIYQGKVSPAAFNPCSLRNPVFDQTGPSLVPDGKVDQQDFDFFTNCATGPTPAPGVFAGLSEQCRCLDLNNDQAIDQEDFGRFQRCYTGPTGTVDPDCDN